MGIFKETLRESEQLKTNVKDIADTYGEIVGHVQTMGGLGLEIEKTNNRIDDKFRPSRVKQKNPGSLVDKNGSPITSTLPPPPQNYNPVSYNDQGFPVPILSREAIDEYWKQYRREHGGPVNYDRRNIALGRISGQGSNGSLMDILGPGYFTSASSGGGSGGGGVSEDTRTGGVGNTPPPVNSAQGYLPPGGKSLTANLTGPLGIIARTVDESGNKTVRAIEKLQQLFLNDGGSDIRRAKL